MTVIMKDVEDSLTEQEKNLVEAGKPDTGINKLFYADDTILMTTTVHAMECLLHAIEKESAKYNMRLNKQKCIVINMNEVHRIEYADGTLVPTQNKATYLGGIITKKSEYKPELNHRIAATTDVLKKLNTLWLKAPISAKWKIRVFDAVCVAKLTYGLETIPVSNEVCKKLDAFYFRALRKITGIKAAYVSRITNAQVLRVANERANLKQGQQLKSITQRLKEKQIKLYGHLIRADINTDHSRRVSIDERGKRVQANFKRVGRPRIKWYDMVRNEVVLNLISQGIIPQNWSWYMRNEELDQIIIDAANERLF
jgi:hypothetical protein